MREPCANWRCVISSRVKITRNSCLHGLLPFKIHDIHSKFWLLKLTIVLQTRGPTYQANNATRKQRNSSPISSRAIMLCNPFRCIFNHVCFNYLRDFGFARNLRVQHEFARSLWKACARVTPFNFLKNKFHLILKSIAGSFESGSILFAPNTRPTFHSSSFHASSSSDFHAIMLPNPIGQMLHYVTYVFYQWVHFFGCIFFVFFVDVFFFGLGVFPCVLLHVGTKICDLLHFGTRIYFWHCSSNFRWFYSIVPWFYLVFPWFHSFFPWFHSICPLFYLILPYFCPKKRCMWKKCVGIGSKEAGYKIKAGGGCALPAQVSMDINKNQIGPNKRWCLWKKKMRVGNKGSDSGGARAQRLPLPKKKYIGTSIDGYQ